MQPGAGTATDPEDATPASPESPATPAGADYVPDPRRWRALSVTLVAGFMSLLDVSIVSVALPSIQSGLGTTPSQVQWIVSGYALAFGLVLVPAGRLGDAIGRRTMFLWALGAFVLFSAMVGAAPNADLLVVARILQGLAAGALAPQNTALIQQLFRGEERGRAFGFFGATVGLSTAIGPVVGGVILALSTGDSGWRWIFLVNLPIGAVALFLAARLIPRQQSSGPREHIDVVGVALLGAGVLALLLPFVEADSGGITGLWWLFVVGAALIVAFSFWERRVVRAGQQPVLDPRLLTETSGYASGIALGTVYFVGFSGIWLVFALYFQNGLHYTPLQSGLSVVSFAIGASASSVIGGRLVERWGRLLTVAGLTLVVIGLAATALVLYLGSSHVGLMIALPMLVAGIGGGWVISPNTTMTLRNVPVRMAGSAGGALQTGQRLGSAVGTALLAGLFYATLSANGSDYRTSVSIAVAGAAVAVTVALGIAVWEWRHSRTR